MRFFAILILTIGASIADESRARIDAAQAVRLAGGICS
jgi:hypothetical protein